MNRLEELAGAATHVAEQPWGTSEALQTAMREIAAILLAASKVDVAGLMELVLAVADAAYQQGSDDEKTGTGSTNIELAEVAQLETALRMALAGREWQGLTDEEVGQLSIADGLHHVEVPLIADLIRTVEANLKEKNAGGTND